MSSLLSDLLHGHSQLILCGRDAGEACSGTLAPRLGSPAGAASSACAVPGPAAGPRLRLALAGAAARGPSP